MSRINEFINHEIKEYGEVHVRLTEEQFRELPIEIQKEDIRIKSLNPNENYLSVAIRKKAN